MCTSVLVCGLNSSRIFLDGNSPVEERLPKAVKTTITDIIGFTNIDDNLEVSNEPNAAGTPNVKRYARTLSS